MKNLKFSQIAVFMIALLSLTTHHSWAQTTVTLPQACDCPADSDPNAALYLAGTTFCSGTATVVQDVTSATGRVWMDRNLGASRVAVAFTDPFAFGDLYQWGRSADGHQCRNSPLANFQATTPLPAFDEYTFGHFVYGGPLSASGQPTTLQNWLLPSAATNNLWQGVNGVNNPCPTGYRLPTKAEWNAEIASWSSQDPAGAFASPLKLTLASVRLPSNGAVSIPSANAGGQYWSSTAQNVTTNTATQMLVDWGGSASTFNTIRSVGNSVRCIKN